VQWAAANEFRNTGWVTSTTPTGWNVTFGTGTTTWNNDGTLTMNTGGSSTRPCINANSFTVSQGIAYTFGYTVVSASGSPQIFNVISSMVAGETFAINGATVGPTTVVQAGDVVSCTFTPTGTTAIPRMGPGVNTGMTNTAMTITRPQMNPGVSLQSYLANSSTTAANNNTPRFDYDPTSIGTPRGLLIEGSANNLVFSSVDLSNATYWSQIGTGIVVQGSQGPSPDGLNNATKIAIGTTGNYIETALGLAANTVYTLSCFVKKVGTNQYASLATGTGSAWVGTGGGVNFDFNNPNASTTSGTTVGWGYTAFRDGWYRVTYTVTTSATPANARMRLRVDTVVGADGYLVYGAQAEAGNGASSYIPTGASTGSRSADECLMDATNFAIGSWYTAAQGTFYTDVEYTALSGNQSGIQLADNSGGSETNRLSIRRGIAIATRGGTTARQFTPTATARAKSAFAYGTADYRFSQNGATFSGIAGDNGASPSSIDRIRMFAPGPTQIYGWLRAIKFWPISQSQSFINALTTL
jgi:hypothetical protein